MSQMPSRFDVLVSEQGKDGKNYYTNIGIGFGRDDGSVSIKLKALPLGGELLLKPARPKEERDAYNRSRENGQQRRQPSYPQRGNYKPKQTRPAQTEAFPEEQANVGDDGPGDDGF